jgi:hypothetical protein
MNRNLLWLIATAIAAAFATLGTIGLLSHIDEGRPASVIGFDAMWIIATLVSANACWRRTKWSRS